MAYGKYREQQREIPYSGLVDALRKVVDQLLAAEPSEMEAYRTELSAALGERLGVIVDLLPGLQFIWTKNIRLDNLVLARYTATGPRR